MGNFSIGKYKNILVSIALFLLLDASVLMLNFYISFQIAEDATSINLAGRQRMLSQRMTKSLLDMDYSSELDQTAFDKALNELQASRNLFDETFTAFEQGGEATGAGGNKVLLNKAEDSSSVAALQAASALWSDYKTRIDNVVSLGTETKQSEALQEAINYGQQNNVAILALMNDLTVSLENVAASKAERLRLIQTAGILMALVNFFIILFHFIGQLRKGDEVLEEARKETTDILQTVNEGLFLIHSDFTVGSQRSEKLYSILNLDEGSSLNFERLLKDIVSENDLEAAQGFLRLLFNPKVKEKLIGDLNPLEKVQVNIDAGSGVYDTRYLSFDFKRVLHENNIVDVLATVNDITENVLLEQQLAKEKENNEKQIEMLTSILHANPSLLKAFLDNAFKCFSRVNNLLKEPSKTQGQFKEKINNIFSEMHNFKGESGALELNDFVTLAHEFESDLDLIRGNETIRGQDFLPLAVRLEKIISYAQSITGLIEKLSGFSYFNNAEAESEAPLQSSFMPWDNLEKFATDLSDKYEKQVVLEPSGLENVSIPESLTGILNSICIQFIRNSVVHGIEEPQARANANKPPEGRIKVHFSTTEDGRLKMDYKDDGAGFDFDKLRGRALSMGKWTAEQIDHWDRKRLLSLIFTPGFSTSDEVTDDAGRGVGMDVIMQKIRQANGKITISYKENQFARFVVSFPHVPMSQVA